MSDRVAVPIARTARVVTDREGRTPTGPVQLARVAANGTRLDGLTGPDGTWTFRDPYPGTVTLLAAAQGLAGAVRLVTAASDWLDELTLELAELPDGGSVIVPAGTGTIPGLDGQLNPIRDSLGRTYIYGTNLSFEEAPDQPFQFLVEEPFSVSDAAMNRFEVTVLAILGRTSLLRYRRLESSPL